jgi:type II secretion system protein N
MKAFVERNKTWLAYILFVVVLTGGLLYYRFPAEAVLDLLKAKAGQANPPLSLTVSRLSPSVRPGLRLEKTKIAVRETPDRVLFQADRLSIRPHLLSFISGDSAYSFDGFAYQGDISGRVAFKNEENTSNMETDVELSGIRLEDYSYLVHLLGSPFQGTLGGIVSCSGPSKNVLKEGSGEARLTIVDGMVKLREPFLTIETIEFKGMDIELILKGGKIDVSRLELKGSQMQGSLSGTIFLKDELVNSNLNLKGTIEPFAAFFESAGGTRDTVAFFKERLKKGPVSFAIRGTLKAPEIDFT